MTAGADAPGGGMAEMNQRVGTGNEMIDVLLGGGFPANTINIIMGEPGSGKTILVEQLLFANAGGDRPVLYLTTLSEPLAKVVRFVQEFSFYDEAKLGGAVLYDDLGGQLAQQGTGVLVPRVEDAIRTLRPRIIVIDSFKALHDLAGSASDVRHLMYDLAGLLTAYDTTAFLVGEYHGQDLRSYPEFAVADGVLELSRRPLGTRDDRYLRILKLRGSRYREGAHAFRITDAGLDVFPRLVSPRIPPIYQSRVERTSIGVPGLDEMLGGGLLRGSATVLAGPSGSGKTTLALQFALEGGRHGEGAIYMNLQENPTQLGRTMQRLAGDPAAAPGMEILYASPVELQVDSIIVDLFRRIEAGAVRRLVLDSIGDLAVAVGEPQRLHDYLYALIQHLSVNGVTSVFTFESTGLVGNDFPTAPISYMADNLVLLGMAGEETLRRSIRVIKSRGSAHDLGVRPMTIDHEGIRLS